MQRATIENMRQGAFIICRQLDQVDDLSASKEEIQSSLDGIVKNCETLLAMACKIRADRLEVNRERGEG